MRRQSGRLGRMVALRRDSRPGHAQRWITVLLATATALPQAHVLSSAAHLEQREVHALGDGCQEADGVQGQLVLGGGLRPDAGQKRTG